MLVAAATIAIPSGPVARTEMPVGALADKPTVVPVATMAVGPDAATPVVAPVAVMATGPLAASLARP